MGVPEDKAGSPQAVVQECSSSDDQPQPSNKPVEDIDGAFLAIVFSAAIPCILVLAVAGAVVGVLLGYRIHFEKPWPRLDTTINSTTSNGVVWSVLDDWKKHGGNSAMFIRFNPTTLTAIATLTGKIIPYLSSSIMALVAFFAARRIMHASTAGNSNGLLSPSQTTILVELLGGSSFTPLGSCVKHHVKTRERWISPLPHAFSALATVTALGILIPAADTWFSTTVSPVKTPHLERVTNTSKLHHYGRGISEYCVSHGIVRPFNYSLPVNSTTNQTSYVETSYPCNMQWTNPPKGRGHSTFFLDNSTESVATLNSLSTSNSWLNHTDKANDTYYYISDPSLGSTVDFSATTLALRTQCTPMTDSCLNSLEGYPGYIDRSYNFSCGTGFTGVLNSNGGSLAAFYTEKTANLGESMAGIGFSPDPELSRMIGSDESNPEFASFGNPLSFGAWSIGWQTAPDGDDGTSDGTEIPWDTDWEIYYDYYWNYAWLLNCSTEVYNVNYTWVNNSVQDWTPRLASADVGGIVSFPFVSGMPAAQLCLGIASGTQNTSLDSDHLASSWADRFSECAIALLAGSLEPVTNEVEQTRDNSFSATRVPLAPLIILLGLKFLYCLAVLILAMAVWYYTDPKKTQSVKQMLSVQGLAASYFSGGPSHQQAAVQNIQQVIGPAASTQDAAETVAAETVAAATVATEAATAVAAVVPEQKISMIQTEMGHWEFVKVVGGKVWSTIEPIVEKQVLSEATGGQYGSDGTQAAQWVNLLHKGK